MFILTDIFRLWLSQVYDPRLKRLHLLNDHRLVGLISVLWKTTSLSSRVTSLKTSSLRLCRAHSKFLKWSSSSLTILACPKSSLNIQHIWCLHREILKLPSHFSSWCACLCLFQLSPHVFVAVMPEDFLK